MIFYNFLIILNKNHFVTDEADDQDGGKSVSDGKPVINTNNLNKNN